jgi:hypothetical protein
MVKIVEETLVRKVRRIPAKGELLVKVGDVVEPETVLVRGTVLNPDVRAIRVYAKLGVDPGQAQKHMLRPSTGPSSACSRKPAGPPSTGPSRPSRKRLGGH